MDALSLLSAFKLRRTCQQCGQKPGDHRISQVVDGQQTILALCAECLQDHHAKMGIDLPPLSEVRCFYCGGAAASLGLNQPWEKAIRRQRLHSTCRRCGTLASELTMEAVSNLPDGLRPEEHIHNLEEMIRTVDERVRLHIRIHRG